ncbi:MAG: hypothetical protein JXR96_27230 [Deltaproteobacteria bacterium]|nr:hypothetical protein [Deltaproteobacteria bacterium]
MRSFPHVLVVLASLGLLWAEAPSRPADDPTIDEAAEAAGTQLAKRRKVRPAASRADDGVLPASPGGRTRITLGEVYIKGQTARAGEVHVLHRKPVGLSSLVRLRRAYRSEIIQTVFPDKQASRE